MYEKLSDVVTANKQNCLLDTVFLLIIK